VSESISKSSQPLASKQKKDGTEKRGWGRSPKQPHVSPTTALVGSQKEPSEVPKSKRPQGRPNGSKNKNWRRRKRRASHRSSQRRSSDRAYVSPARCWRSSFLLGLDNFALLPPPPALPQADHHH
ncbi:hypothetical protein EGM_18636, partial [Macaca fascicularis]